MRILIPLFLLIISGLNLKGQTLSEPIEGTVSYKTSQNVYVKFKSTEKITVGDTLYFKQGDNLVPALTVNNLSSISCVCSPISTIELSVNDILVANSKKTETPSEKKDDTVSEADILPLTPQIDTITENKIAPAKPKQQLFGRIAAASYTNFSNSSGSNSQRMRYTFSLNANNIGDSKLSAETYISFVHTLNEWSEVQSNIFNGLKVYSLALNYDFNEKYRITLGRKINPKISNIGSIDGLQFEAKIKSFTLGVVGGTRPDYEDYSFNPKLFQYGAYVAHDHAEKNGTMQTSLAYIEQQNSGNIDRRFIYLQHYNSLAKNLYFFGSVEVNLYKKVMNPVDSITLDTTYNKDNSPNVNNLYLMLRYRVIRQLSFSLSYSSRQNIIYYETYKDFLDRLLDTQTLQGFLLQVNSSPAKNLSIGIRAGYRYRTSDPKPSENLYVYLTYGRIPGLNIAATVSATFLQTSYIHGSIYSIGLSRDLIPGKVSGSLSYRYVDYNFYNFETSQAQNIAEINIIWRIVKKLSLAVYYEGTIEKQNTFNRIYVNLTQRF